MQSLLLLLQSTTLDYVSAMFTHEHVVTLKMLLDRNDLTSNFVQEADKEDVCLISSSRAALKLAFIPLARFRKASADCLVAPALALRSLIHC